MDTDSEKEEPWQGYSRCMSTGEMTDTLTKCWKMMSLRCFYHYLETQQCVPVNFSCNAIRSCWKLLFCFCAWFCHITCHIRCPPAVFLWGWAQCQRWKWSRTQGRTWKKTCWKEENWCTKKTRKGSPRRRPDKDMKDARINSVNRQFIDVCRGYPLFRQNLGWWTMDLSRLRWLDCRTFH